MSGKRTSCDFLENILTTSCHQSCIEVGANCIGQVPGQEHPKSYLKYYKNSNSSLKCDHLHNANYMQILFFLCILQNVLKL